MCLPVRGLGYSSERVHLNGCAYELVGLDTVPGALERLRLQVNGLGYSSERVYLNGRAYQLVGFHTVFEQVHLFGCVGLDTVLVGLDTVLSGCT